MQITSLAQVLECYFFGYFWRLLREVSFGRHEPQEKYSKYWIDKIAQSLYVFFWVFFSPLVLPFVSTVNLPLFKVKTPSLLKTCIPVFFPSIPEVERALGKCEEESGGTTVNRHVFHPICIGLAKCMKCNYIAALLPGSGSTASIACTGHSSIKSWVLERDHWRTSSPASCPNHGQPLNTSGASGL